MRCWISLVPFQIPTSSSISCSPSLACHTGFANLALWEGTDLIFRNIRNQPSKLYIYLSKKPSCLSFKRPKCKFKKCPSSITMQRRSNHQKQTVRKAGVELYRCWQWQNNTLISAPLLIQVTMVKGGFGPVISSSFSALKAPSKALNRTFV